MEVSYRLAGGKRSFPPALRGVRLTMWLLQTQFLPTLLTEQLSVKVRAIFARIHRTVVLLHCEKAIKLITHYFPLSFFFFLARFSFCLDGWSSFRGNCYYVGHSAETWANAEVGQHLFICL